jgi:hypothetical protein
MHNKIRVRFVNESALYSELIAISNYFGHCFVNKDRIREASPYGYTMSQLSLYAKEEGFAQWHVSSIYDSLYSSPYVADFGIVGDGLSPILLRVSQGIDSYWACGFMESDGRLIVYPPKGKVRDTTVKDFFKANVVSAAYTLFSIDDTPLIGDNADAKDLLKPYEISVTSESLPLALRYALSVKDYVQMFCDKQDLQFDGWVGGDIGGIAGFAGEYHFNISDITFDIDKGCPPGLILRWQLEGIEAHLLNPGVHSFMNYKSYSMGLRYHQIGLPNNPGKKDKDSSCPSPCGLNYCDENGCMNRTRILTDPAPVKDDGLTDKEWKIVTKSLYIKDNSRKFRKK